MYYLRTITDEISIKGLWLDKDAAIRSALTESKRIKEVVCVMSVDAGRSIYNTVPNDFL